MRIQYTGERHTPGPWNAHGLFVTVDDEKGSKFDVTVCNARPGNSGTPDGYANARLIAAAPLMYELLKAAYEQLSSDSTLKTVIRVAIDEVKGHSK